MLNTIVEEFVNERLPETLEEEKETEILTPFQYYMLGWLKATEYTIDEDKECIHVDINEDEDFAHLTNLTKTNDNYDLVRHEPGLFKSFIHTRTCDSELFVYDDVIMRSLHRVYNDNLHFKRGYFDAAGFIKVKNYITCFLPSNDLTDTLFIKEIDKYNAEYNANTEGWFWEENDALNFLCELYDIIATDKPADELYLPSNLEKIKDAKHIVLEEVPKFIYYRIRSNAMSPFKQFATHPGFSISAVEKTDEKDGIHYYATGLRFSCEYGYYLEIYGEELYKRGYMMANPFDILKPGDDSELIVPLIKLNPDVKDLELPYHVVNIVPKKLDLVEFYELENKM